MNLTPMRFKDYVWPHNPRVYEIGFQRDVHAQRVPFGAYVLQDMGRHHRVLKGEGEFTGEGAYREFQKLATLFYDPKPGVLVHPLWNTTKAHLVSLSLRQEPTENYVAYAFEFWESYDGYTAKIEKTGASAAVSVSTADSGEEYYTAVRGDCMWNIARDHGLTLQALLALNPQVKNPNILMVGDRLRVK